jgi:hypothetical protein
VRVLSQVPELGVPAVGLCASAAIENPVQKISVNIFFIIDKSKLASVFKLN